MEELAAGVREVLAERGIDAGDLSLTKIPGGASRETWLAEGAAGRWVLRRDPRGSVSLVPMADEFALISRAAEAGVPVPGPARLRARGRAVRTRRDPDGPRRGHLGRAADPAQAGVRGRAGQAHRTARPRRSARIHSHRSGRAWAGSFPSHWEIPPSIRSRSGSASSTRSGSRCPRSSSDCAGCAPTPPSPRSRALSTATSGSATSSSTSDGLAAVIDWELAHLGDPAEDVGWLCIRSWRFGNDEQPVAGVGRARRVHLCLRVRRGRAGRSGPCPLLGGVRQRQVGGDLRAPGARPSDGPAPKPRARLARAADLRAGVGPAGS